MSENLISFGDPVRIEIVDVNSIFRRSHGYCPQRWRVVAKERDISTLSPVSFRPLVFAIGMTVMNQFGYPFRRVHVQSDADSHPTGLYHIFILI